jgi:hypothetical protein
MLINMYQFFKVIYKHYINFIFRYNLLNDMKKDIKSIMYTIEIFYNFMKLILQVLNKVELKIIGNEILLRSMVKTHITTDI